MFKSNRSETISKGDKDGGYIIFKGATVRLSADFLIAKVEVRSQ